MKPTLAGKKTVVYGLGRSGAAAARLLVREGARVTGLDKRPEAELAAVAAELRSAGASLGFGSVPRGLLSSADLVGVSPGVPLSLPEIQKAKSAGIKNSVDVTLA